MAEFYFDPSSVPPSDFPSFDPIPHGDYNLQVIGSELKDTKSGTGKILKLTLEVLDGEYAGRRIFDNLNVQNQNPEAERISKQSLAALLYCVGLNALHNSEELHYRPFRAKVSVDPGKNPQFGPQNRVRYPAPRAQQPMQQQHVAPPFPPMGQAARTPIQPQPTTNKPWTQPKPRV